MTRSRAALSILLIVCLLATGAMRGVVQDRHDSVIPRARTASRLSGLDSFTLGLLLGGLRGPLVMVLWSSSENQKVSKDLEDINTKIELIRMLQPEFDTVHLFQMWNLAYNIQVMMANIQNKYTTILSAIDYGHSVLDERPDALNILYQIGDIYFNKLGNTVGSATDRRYYNARLASETLPSLSASPKLQKGQPGWRRTRHDVLLDSNGLILPSLLEPRPGSVPIPGYTGAELQFLATYNSVQAGGFPYGIHPLALAYNYFKRAAVIQFATGQKHLQIGDSVIDNRPGTALKYWSEVMWEHARRLEAQALGKEPTEDRLQLEALTAATPLNSPLVNLSDNTRKLVEEAIFTYRRAATVSADAIAEFRRHAANPNYADSLDNVHSTIDAAGALSELLQADCDYFAAIAASSSFAPPIVARSQTASLHRSAAQHYRKSIDLYYLVILKYYTDDTAAKAVYPKLLGLTFDEDKNRFNKAKVLQSTDPKLYPALHAAVTDYHKAAKLPRDWGDDIAEYETYIRRANQRLSLLPSSSGPAPLIPTDVPQLPLTPAPR